METKVLELLKYCKRKLRAGDGTEHMNKVLLWHDKCIKKNSSDTPKVSGQ